MMEYDDHEEDEFSMSSYDGEQGDSLVIKPPQAVILRKERREKRKDRHRHKGDRHKERHKSREHRIHDDRRREHRRHRERDGNRREIRKRRDRPGKQHEIGDLRNKLDNKEQFDDSIMPESIFHKRYREREEFYMGDREFDRGRLHGHRERRHEDKDMYADPSAIMSSQDRVERDKRMERMLQAEMQKELSQKEADARRQKREEEKREEKMIEELRQKAQASMMRRTRSSPRNRESRVKRRKYSTSSAEPEIMELSEDEEETVNSPIEEEHEHVEKISSGEEDLSNASSSEQSEGHVESDSRSSSEALSDKEDSNEEISDRKSRSRSASPSQSGSSSDSTEEDVDNIKEMDGAQDVKEVSPKKSPSPVKLPIYYPAIMGCRSVDEFECLNRIEEGTYGVVYRAREKTTDQIVALKRLKMEKEKEGFPITSLREVNTLLKGQHENIVTVREIVVGSNMDKIYIVMDYVEHDLKSLMETMRQKKQAFAIGEVKTLMIQLLKAVHHLHDNWILHRDLKTSNLLLSHRGILKVGDFGLAREYGSPLKQYTPIVVTLWYRAPELLLGTKLYACPIDVWSVGCIFGELLGMESMFPGKSEIDMLNRIYKELGAPSEKIWPGYNQLPVVKKTQFADFQYNHLRERFKARLSDEGFNLLNRFLTYNPSKRITCADALQHDYFLVELPAPIDSAMFPTWPAKSENPHGRTKKSSPKPPSGGKNFKDLGDGEDESIAGFFLGGEAPRGPGFTLKF